MKNQITAIYSRTYIDSAEVCAKFEFLNTRRKSVLESPNMQKHIFIEHNT